MGWFGNDSDDPSPGEVYAESERLAAIEGWNIVFPDDPHGPDGLPLRAGKGE